MVSTASGSTSNEQTIANFLASKGLNPAQVSGILGNLQVESGFSPTAANSSEGAIGIAQWENGRRTALDAYAKSVGGKETDLSVQLGYLWHELSGPYASVLSTIRGQSDPAAVAATWDSSYEISAGTSRTQRVANARTIYQQLTGGASLAGGGTATLTSADSSGAAGITSPISGIGGVLGGITTGWVKDVINSVLPFAVRLGFVGLGGGLVLLGTLDLTKKAGVDLQPVPIPV